LNCCGSERSEPLKVIRALPMPKLLVKTSTTCGGAVGFAGSKALTAPLAPVVETPLMSRCPPPATQTKAFAPPGPAKRMWGGPALASRMACYKC
jgi:hypothetical protein